MIVNSDAIISVHHHSHASTSIHILKLSDNVDIEDYINQSEYCRELNVYLIVFNISSGLMDPINKYIPEEVLTKIYNKEVFLVIYSPIESAYRYVDFIYENYITTHLIPESQIIFVGGSIDYEPYILKTSMKYQKNPIKLELYYPLIKDIRGILSNYYNTDKIINLPSPLTKNKTNKKFLFINHNSNPHRVSMLCLLNSRNLIDYGHISFFKYISAWNLNLDYAKKNYTTIIDELDKGCNIIDRLPFTLDKMPFNLDHKQFAYVWSPVINKFYNDSYFSIVAETIYNENSPIMFTEKVLKCMLYKHPFILIAKSKTLALLRRFGFKTFNGIINEEYDNEIDPSRRLKMIIDEATRLCSLSEKDLTTFKRSALEIVEYNYTQLFNMHQLVFKVL